MFSSLLYTFNFVDYCLYFTLQSRCVIIIIMSNWIAIIMKIYFQNQNIILKLWSLINLTIKCRLLHIKMLFTDHHHHSIGIKTKKRKNIVKLYLKGEKNSHLRDYYEWNEYNLLSQTLLHLYALYDDYTFIKCNVKTYIPRRWINWIIVFSACQCRTYSVDLELIHFDSL